MSQIQEEKTECIRCDTELQTYGPVEERGYKELNRVGAGIYAVCDDCWEEVEDRAFA